MNGPFRLGPWALVLGWIAAVVPQPQAASAQSPTDRFRVLVPEIQALNGADKKFGERLADKLRDLINQMDTHQPIEERELKNSLKEHSIDMEDLNCVMAKQLAPLINAQVVFCGDYGPDGDGLRVETKFISSSGEEFPVDPITVQERGQEEAAQHIYQALQVQSDQDRFAQFCGDYATSQQWDEAENMCTRAIELNPLAVNSRYTLAVVYQKTDRIEEALAEFERVLETDQLHQEAMQWAGNLSATLGRDERAREYYQQYLQLNPANANVRMRVAYDLAQAGDALGAMQIIEEGLGTDPENVDLLKQHGGFAFTAGAELNQGKEEMPPEAVQLFRKALESYDKAYSIEGAEMDVAFLANMVKAYVNLSESEAAVAMAERILETHEDQAIIWSYYADALKRSDRLDDALAALDRTAQLDPEYQNVSARQGQWLLEERRFEEAKSAFVNAVRRGEQTPDAVGDILFTYGYREGVQPEEWSYAITVFRLAKEFDLTDTIEQKVNFFLGYAVFKDAITRQEPRTKQTAEATLPLFQEARHLLQASAGYARTQGTLENDRVALLENVAVFIEIQEAIIKRGGNDHLTDHEGRRQ